MNLFNFWVSLGNPGFSRNGDSLDEVEAFSAFVLKVQTILCEAGAYTLGQLSRRAASLFNNEITESQSQIIIDEFIRLRKLNAERNKLRATKKRNYYRYPEDDHPTVEAMTKKAKQLRGDSYFTNRTEEILKRHEELMQKKVPIIQREIVQKVKQSPKLTQEENETLQSIMQGCEGVTFNPRKRYEYKLKETRYD